MGFVYHGGREGRSKILALAGRAGSGRSLGAPGGHFRHLVDCSCRGSAFGRGDGGTGSLHQWVIGILLAQGREDPFGQVLTLLERTIVEVRDKQRRKS